MQPGAERNWRSSDTIVLQGDDHRETVFQVTHTSVAHEIRERARAGRCLKHLALAI